MMKTIAGMKHGVLHQKLLLIQITPLYPKRWKNGLNKFLENLLPRHLQIIYEINRRFLEEVKEKYSKDQNVLDKLTIISAGKDKRVRMANLAIVGSFAVNGVAALHTSILKKRIFPDFNKIYPKKFINVTNGITPRRWLVTANPLLTQLISEKIGQEWIKDLGQIKKIEKFVKDKDFIESWQRIKLNNKKVLN